MSLDVRSNHHFRRLAVIGRNGHCPQDLNWPTSFYSCHSSSYEDHHGLFFLRLFDVPRQCPEKDSSGNKGNKGIRKI